MPDDAGSFDPLPEYYRSMIRALDRANDRLKSGDYAQAYSICDDLIGCLRQNDIQAFTFDE